MRQQQLITNDIKHFKNKISLKEKTNDFIHVCDVDNWWVEACTVCLSFYVFYVFCFFCMTGIWNLQKTGCQTLHNNVSVITIINRRVNCLKLYEYNFVPQAEYRGITIFDDDGKHNA